MRAGIGRSLARATAGFVAGAAIWVGLASPYHRIVAAPAELLIRTFESPPLTRLLAQGREILVQREDFPPAAAEPGIPADDLDFNIAILTALFATARRPFSDAGLRRLGLALAILWATHVAAVVAAVESLYATSFGPWSTAHYGFVARNIWATANHFYRIAGMFAIPFALWWALASDFARAARERAGLPRRAKTRRSS